MEFHGTVSNKIHLIISLFNYPNTQIFSISFFNSLPYLLEKPLDVFYGNLILTEFVEIKHV